MRNTFPCPFPVLALLSLACAPLALSAQVGVNQPTPEQALDVGGKLKLADDAVAPTAGTLRYNGTAADFQGYDGASWRSLTTGGSGAGPLPSGPQFVQGGTGSVAQNPGTQAAATFRSNPNGKGSTFQAVPDGKILIITGIYPSATIGRDDAVNTNLNLGFAIGPKNAGSSLPPSLRSLRIHFRSLETPHITGDAAPLIVLTAGEELDIFHFGTSQAPLRVSVRGFLVDALDY